MDITVVIPTYNSGRFLVEAIDSALAQTLAPSEVIVVDDGSTDDTCERLRPYGGSVRLLAQENRGVSAARNLGVREARGGLIAFLDADDVWHPRKLELQVGVFEADRDLGLLGTSSFDWPAASLPELGPERPGPVVQVTWDQLAVKNRLTTSSVVARREILARAGQFDTELQGPEDRDLWLRVAEFARVAYLDRPLTGYRAGVPGSVSKQPEVCQAGMLRILGKLEGRRAWAGKALLRRKSYGYVYHSCAFLHAEAGAYRTAVRNMLRSFLWFPFPYRRDEVRTPLERPKRLAAALLQMFARRRPWGFQGRAPVPTADDRPVPNTPAMPGVASRSQ
jgi:glycosyltransferase involved in cell wall biosynthesis